MGSSDVFETADDGVKIVRTTSTFDFIKGEINAQSRFKCDREEKRSR